MTNTAFEIIVIKLHQQKCLTCWSAAFSWRLSLLCLSNGVWSTQAMYVRFYTISSLLLRLLSSSILLIDGKTPAYNSGHGEWQCEWKADRKWSRFPMTPAFPTMPDTSWAAVQRLHISAQEMALNTHCSHCLLDNDSRRHRSRDWKEITQSSACLVSMRI